MARVTVLDASALIALCSTEDDHHRWALDMFSITQGSDLMISALTYAEFLVGPKRQKKLQQVLDGTSQLGLEITTLDNLNAISLAEVRANSNLRLPDAVVLQTALEHSGAIATTDKRLANAARELNLPVYQP
jgi:hypothetical protein